MVDEVSEIHEPFNPKTAGHKCVQKRPEYDAHQGRDAKSDQRSIQRAGEEHQRLSHGIDEGIGLGPGAGWWLIHELHGLHPFLPHGAAGNVPPPQYHKPDYRSSQHQIQA